MIFPFWVTIIAMLFSFFVAGAVLGAFFSRTNAEREASVREAAYISLIRALSSKNLATVLLILERLPDSA